MMLSIAVGVNSGSELLNARNLKEGTANLQQAPKVSFQNLDGQTVSLSHYRGKVVLLNFWGTWCGVCMSEIPELIQLQQEYGDKGFTVLGVAMGDSKAAVASFIAKRQFNLDGQKVAMNYPVVLGNQQEASKFGCCVGYPDSYIISRDGKLVQKVMGSIDAKSVSQALQKLL
ncbi:MAG TPA: TlpA disulfide reductase family protein [Terriglobia bacterium]|nr:TlpA disulfide reductase family protein [Terriglobia bacterium]